MRPPVSPGTANSPHPQLSYVTHNGSSVSFQQQQFAAVADTGVPFQAQIVQSAMKQTQAGPSQTFEASAATQSSGGHWSPPAQAEYATGAASTYGSYAQIQPDDQSRVDSDEDHSKLRTWCHKLGGKIRDHSNLWKRGQESADPPSPVQEQVYGPASWSAGPLSPAHGPAKPSRASVKFGSTALKQALKAGKEYFESGDPEQEQGDHEGTGFEQAIEEATGGWNADPGTFEEQISGFSDSAVDFGGAFE